MGTPDFSVPALRAVAARCDVTLVVTQPDRPRGRGRQIAESEVAAVARELGLPVLKPEDMKTDEVFEALSAQNADAFAVVAFGAILTPRVLALPRAGCVNLHGSLLPDYRGASPVQRALWDGRTETGVCTIFMDEGIDTGDIVLSHSESIRDDDDAASLAARLAEAGGPLLAGSVVLAHEGRAMRSRQDRTAGSYAKKLKKSDGIVDWSLTAREVWCHARAVTPWPGATAMHDGKRLLVVRSQVVAGQGKPGTVLAVEHEGVAVACGTDALRLIRVKPEGRAEMAASEWARGARVSLGDHGLYSKESMS